MARRPPPRFLNCKLETGKGKQRSVRTGTGLLAEDQLRFRTGRTGREGRDFFVHIPYDQIESIELTGNKSALVLTTVDGDSYTLHVGVHAAAWKALMKAQPSVLEDMEIDPKSRIAADGVTDEELLNELSAVRGFPATESAAAPLDVLLLGVEHPADLARMPAAARRVKREVGVLWVLYPPRTLSEERVRAHARSAGLEAGDALVLNRTLEALPFRVS